MIAPQPANDAAFTPTIRRPPRLRLHLGASRVFRQNEQGKPDELWQGAGAPLDDDGDDVPIYFRLATGSVIAAELVCSLLAQALGLPTPQPYLLEIAADALPESRFLQPGQPRICVATFDVGGTTFGQLLNAQSDYARKLLLHWKHLVPTISFDEWIANVDRNWGNILFVANALWLIDHADTLGGSSRQLFPLADLYETSFTNKLAALLERGSAGQRLGTLQQAREWLTFTAGGLDLDSTVELAELQRWHSPVEERELLDFLQKRLLLTYSLLCNRLGHSQLLLNPQPSAVAASS